MFLFLFSGLEGLTQEQLAVVNHPIKPGETIKVIAFAGKSHM